MVTTKQTNTVNSQSGIDTNTDIDIDDPRILSLRDLGWYLYDIYQPDHVGSWLIHHNNQALLLEVPRGLKVRDVNKSLLAIGDPNLIYVTASHNHEDHLDISGWNRLKDRFPKAHTIHPSCICVGPVCEKELYLDGESLWLVRAPKHSWSDVVTIFRGVAMTGDIELGTVFSVSKEVPKSIRRNSMNWLRDFPKRNNYRIHTIVSAHIDDFRASVDWQSLFTI